MKIYYCDEITDRKSQHSLAYLLLKYALQQEYFIEAYPHDLVIETTAYGKPYLRDYPHIHFNISHSGELVACAVSAEETGLDVERRFPWKDRLAKRICHPEELEYLCCLEDAKKADAGLNLLWSMKEGYLKYQGTGIRSELRALNLGTLLPRALEDREKGFFNVRCFDCIFSGLQTEQYTLVCCGLEMMEKPVKVGLDFFQQI